MDSPLPAPDSQSLPNVIVCYDLPVEGRLRWLAHRKSRADIGRIGEMFAVCLPVSVYDNKE